MARGIVIAANASDARIMRPRPTRKIKSIVGSSIVRVSRRGKWLRIEFDRGARLFSHLGMSGEWIACGIDEKRAKHEHVRIDVKTTRGEKSVRYVDPRKFGRIVMSDEDIEEWRELGPDPLTDGIDANDLARRLKASRRSIKTSLMDQTILAGIGNILATDALFHARIDPRSRSNALDARAIAKLARALEHEVKSMIAENEACEGEPEQSKRGVYGRGGEACPRCGSRLSRILLDGRGTTFCPRCQNRAR
jgi:formamidopyrimidine-DNA glycosylase